MPPPVPELTGPPFASALVSRSFLPDAPGLVVGVVGTAALRPRVCVSGVTVPVIEQTNFAAISHTNGLVGEDGTSAFPTCVACAVRPSFRSRPILRHRSRSTQQKLNLQVSDQAQCNNNNGSCCWEWLNPY